MRAPIIYEINTRCWLRELSERAGRPVTLSDVPESEIERWRKLGFTHIWLMGVWQVGEGPREIALRFWREKWRSEIPSDEADVHGSPFAVREYAVDSRLGEAISLLLLKERFARAGLRLILDFIPNHLGLDSPEPERYPARFVQGSSAGPGVFERKTRFGKRHFAHGRDPYFPPWIDTVQLDYRLAETQETMAAVAQTVSMFGHGLRCDMSMLMLPEVFHETWKPFPAQVTHRNDGSFWRTAIPRIRQLQPSVDLIAEVYWDREQELQDLGFDYTYNKKVCDFIVRGQFAELSAFLTEKPLSYLERSVHFLENHDEQRAAVALPLELHKVAALLIFCLPGMALLHEGQLEGRKSFAPIQLCKRVPEDPDPEISAYYNRLLGALPGTWIRRGRPRVLHQAADAAIQIAWTGSSGETDVALINLGSEPVRTLLRSGSGGHLKQLFSAEPERPMEWRREGELTLVEMPARSGVVLRSVGPAV